MRKNYIARILQLLLLISSSAWAYPPPPVDPSLPPSSVEPAVQQLRRAMLDPDVNSLTFHNMDHLGSPTEPTGSGPSFYAPQWTFNTGR